MTAAIAHRFTFPLREDLDAVLSLPRDLTKDEARRLEAFINSIAVADAAGVLRDGAR